MDDTGLLIPLNEIKVEIKEEIVEDNVNVIEEVIVKEEPQEWAEIEVNVEVKQEQDSYEPITSYIEDIPHKAKVPKRKRVIEKEKKSLECNLCGKSFKLRIALDVHRKTHKKSPQEKYLCDFCSYSHLSLCRIRSHMTKHLKHKVYFCKYCEMQYPTRKTLNSHLKVHKDQKKAAKLVVAKTSNCDVKIKVDSMKTEHSDKKFLICPECDKLCPNLSSLKRHLISHQNFKIFECDLCGRAFKRREHIKQHMNVHLDIRPHSCEICWKSFKSRGELTKHLVIHSETKPHACPICSKTFRTKAEVRLHSVVHTDFRPFGCENCSKFFKTKGELRKHKKVHSLDKPVCNLCGRKFRDEKSLQKHGEWHEKRPTVYENYPAVQMGNQQVFECDICFKNFALKVRLRRHKDSVHRLDRPFLCDICKRGYKSKDEIKKHIVIHLDSRNYKCEICQFSFKRSHDLVRHNKLHAQGRINIKALFGKTKLSYKMQKLA